MRRIDSILTILLLASLAFCAVYSLNPPTPRYFPLERAWHVTAEGQGPGMGWYGRSGAALLGGLLAGCCGYLWTALRSRHETRPLKPATVWLLSAILFVALGLTAAKIVHEQQVWFVKSPAPLAQPAEAPADSSPQVTGGE
ncbi:MAG: hypothetical protein IT365_08425 [Candidatus Hydrogenedentes bacterium]|nr:hypothetical protein [Candidatus Hydrogenedentota bacterium]